MFERLRTRLQVYITENFEDLLALDLKWARLFGAPAPHTISSYVYLLETKNKPFGKFLRPVIDKLFLWLFEQTDHCKQDFERVNGFQRTTE
jgi:hypothetical protein